jgi:hypothetical protein
VSRSRRKRVGLSLSDYRPEMIPRSAQIVISTLEGARFVPGDFLDGQEIIDDLDLLFTLDGANKGRPNGAV